jgi:hypothetical protein
MTRACVTATSFLCSKFIKTVKFWWSEKEEKETILVNNVSYECHNSDKKSVFASSYSLISLTRLRSGGDGENWGGSGSGSGSGKGSVVTETTAEPWMLRGRAIGESSSNELRGPEPLAGLPTHSLAVLSVDDRRRSAKVCDCRWSLTAGTAGSRQT